MTDAELSALDDRFSRTWDGRHVSPLIQLIRDLRELVRLTEPAVEAWASAPPTDDHDATHRASVYARVLEEVIRR